MHNVAVDGRVGQSGGPATRVIRAVWRLPSVLVQETVTCSPGECALIKVPSVSADVTVRPSTDVIVSPACIPASAAGEPDVTLSTTAPPPVDTAETCTPIIPRVPM